MTPTPSTPSLSSLPPTISRPSPAAPLWRAHVHSRTTGRLLLRLQVSAPDLRAAETHALSTAGLTLRLGPCEVSIPRLHQIA